MATATARLEIERFGCKNAWTLASQFKFACIVVPARLFLPWAWLTRTPTWAWAEEIRNPLTGLLSGTELSRCDHFFSVCFAYQGSPVIKAVTLVSWFLIKAVGRPTDERNSGATKFHYQGAFPSGLIYKWLTGANLITRRACFLFAFRWSFTEREELDQVEASVCSAWPTRHGGEAVGKTILDFRSPRLNCQSERRSRFSVFFESHTKKESASIRSPNLNLRAAVVEESRDI